MKYLSGFLISCLYSLGIDPLMANKKLTKQFSQPR